MSLPYRISDRVVFTVLVTTTAPQPIVPQGDKFERSMDLLLRADPDNANDQGDPRDVEDSIVYVGNADQQQFPLKPDQSLNLRVTRRNDIYFRGAVAGLKLHMVAALLDID